MLERLDAPSPAAHPHRHQGRSEAMENLSIKPIVPATSLRTLAYEALKSAITNMDIYGQSGDVRLDERGLSQTLGVSRTPIHCTSAG